MTRRLTRRRLGAIIEALIFRTAGEIEDEEDERSMRREDYEAGLEWALSELARRENASGR